MTPEEKYQHAQALETLREINAHIATLRPDTQTTVQQYADRFRSMVSHGNYQAPARLAMALVGAELAAEE